MSTVKKPTPAPKPISDKEKQDLAKVAANCSAQICAGVATTLVGNNEWAAQLVSLNKVLMSDIYKFISTPQ